MAITVSDLLSYNDDKFIAVLNEYKTHFNLLNAEDNTHIAKLISAVKYNIEFIKVIPRNLQTESLVEVYLNKKLISTDAVDKNLVLTSYDDKTIFKIFYAVKLEYIDAFIGVPTEFQLEIELKLKIVSPLRFLNNLDLSYNDISLKNVIEHFTAFLSAESKFIIADLLIDKEVSYFDMPKYFTRITEKISDEIDTSSQGVEIIHCVIKDMKVPDNVKQMVSEGYFNNKQKEIFEKAQQDKDEFALKIYKEKALISKDTGVKMHLTETEKDYAINRYVQKMELSRTKEAPKVIYRPEVLPGLEDGDFHEGTTNELPELPKNNNPRKPTLLITLAFILSIVFGVVTHLRFSNYEWSIIAFLGSLILLVTLALILNKHANRNRYA
jgi:hypothetical protein